MVFVDGTWFEAFCPVCGSNTGSIHGQFFDGLYGIMKHVFQTHKGWAKTKGIHSIAPGKEVCTLRHIDEVERKRLEAGVPGLIAHISSSGGPNLDTNPSSDTSLSSTSLSRKLADSETPIDASYPTVVDIGGEWF